MVTSTAAHSPEVVCLGESMVTFLPSRPGPLAEVPSFARSLGGAESNVACTLTAAGHHARWVSRVGADGFGDYLAEAIAAHGVDVSHVRRDPVRPTGIYFRTAGERSTRRPDAETEPPAPVGDSTGVSTSEVVYYRAGSAASAMAPSNIDTSAADAGRVLHLTGITAALSADCLALLRRLTGPRSGRPLVSFDVNYRAGLWPTAPAGPGVLLELARGCDIVFTGEDEATAAWGVDGGPAAVRAALPEPSVLVVKQGAAGATLFGPGAEEGVFCPAPEVEVSAPVGAGDAFAAGFLSATLRGLGPRERLRHGHLWAAATLAVPDDLAAPPAREHADALVALSDHAWERLHLGAGAMSTDMSRPEGVRAP